MRMPLTFPDTRQAELNSVSVPSALVHQRQTAELRHLTPVQELLEKRTPSH